MYRHTVAQARLTATLVVGRAPTVTRTVTVTAGATPFGHSVAPFSVAIADPMPEQ